MFIEKQDRTIRTLYTYQRGWCGLFFFFLVKIKFHKSYGDSWLMPLLSVSLTCRGRFWHYLRVNLGQRRRKEIDAEKSSLGMMRRNLGRPGEVTDKISWTARQHLRGHYTQSHTGYATRSLCTYLSIWALWVQKVELLRSWWLVSWNNRLNSAVRIWSFTTLVLPPCMSSQRTEKNCQKILILDLAYNYSHK